MKTLLRVVLMVTVCTVAMSFTNHSMTSRVTDRVSFRKLRQPRITFVDDRGHTISVAGRGTYGSGNIVYFISDTDQFGNVVAAGSASGSYNLNSGSYTDGTIDCTYAPSGSSNYFFSGPASFDFN